jgi:ABC-2 type transport system ATP-binding protein
LCRPYVMQEIREVLEIMDKSFTIDDVMRIYESKFPEHYLEIKEHFTNQRRLTLREYLQGILLGLSRRDDTGLQWIPDEQQFNVIDPMKPILQLAGVTGGYIQPVIKNVSFDVHKNEIVALLGLNGAGKSTTIKHILGLMEPMEGSISIYDKTFYNNPDTYRSYYAYIPETPIYYKELTLWEHLEFTAMTYGVQKETFHQRIYPLLEKFHMDPKVNAFPDHFSKGMRQKMMIMMALMIRPSLYIIDEPLMGLDPLGIRTLLECLEEAKNEGAGILMSTHILATAERYCNRFIIMHEGQIIAQGTLEELQKQANVPYATLDDLYLKFVEGR